MFSIIYVHYTDGSEGSFMYTKETLNQIIKMSEIVDNIEKVVIA